jgi:NADH-quinone oxidoreductase subunit C
MSPDEFLPILQARFPQVEFRLDPLNPQALIMSASGVPEVFSWLRDAPEAAMEYLEFSTAVDRPPDRLCVVYSLYSYTHRHRLILKVDLPRHDPTIPTVSHLWENADWNEREIYDLFGVFFSGHEDLRRLMMPEDWEGHPLRKDYNHPNLTPRPD